ncbi:hypothetical protein DIPPA_11226 [Diplonema papillatum]|nr:hypothetical protein DIPPA_11226 [Diplonema papillatum]
MSSDAFPLRRVLSFCDEGAVCKAAAVCRQWRDVAEEEGTWQGLCQTLFGVVAKPSNVPTWKAWFRVVQKPEQNSLINSLARAEQSPNSPNELLKVLKSQGERIAQMDLQYAAALGTIRQMCSERAKSCERASSTSSSSPGQNSLAHTPRVLKQHSPRAAEPVKDGIEVTSDGTVLYQDERATFVDATFDEDFVVRRLSSSPTAAAILSPYRTKLTHAQLTRAQSQPTTTPHSQPKFTTPSTHPTPAEPPIITTPLTDAPLPANTSRHGSTTPPCTSSSEAENESPMDTELESDSDHGQDTDMEDSNDQAVSEASDTSSTTASSTPAADDVASRVRPSSPVARMSCRTSHLFGGVVESTTRDPRKAHENERIASGLFRDEKEEEKRAKHQKCEQLFQQRLQYGLAACITTEQDLQAYHETDSNDTVVQSIPFPYEETPYSIDYCLSIANDENAALNFMANAESNDEVSDFLNKQLSDLFHMGRRTMGPKLSQGVHHVLDENKKLRAMAAHMESEARKLSKQLKHELKQGRKTKSAHIAVLSRLEESKRCVKKLKLYIAKSKVQTLPLHNEILKARDEQAAIKMEKEEIEELKLQVLEQRDRLWGDLQATGAKVVVLEQMLQDMEKRHEQNLKDALTANCTVNSEAPLEAENATLRINMEGLQQVLLHSYMTNQKLREKLVNVTHVRDDARGRLQECQDAYNALVHERQEEREQWFGYEEKTRHHISALKQTIAALQAQNQNLVSRQPVEVSHP